MKAPGKEVYGQEDEALKKGPAKFERFDGEDAFESALLTDRWYIWPVSIALTLAWLAVVVVRWPVGGVAALIEVATCAGIAAQQVESRGKYAYARSGLGFVVWGTLACIGAANAVTAALWLIGGLLVSSGMLLGKSANWWLWLIACALPWLQGSAVGWELKLVQTVLLFSGAFVVVYYRQRLAQEHALRLWQRSALVAWIVLVMPVPADLHLGAISLLKLLGLIVALLIYLGFRHQRAFISVVLVWAALHALGLRTAGGALGFKLALIVPGFLLLVIAGWRFTVNSRLTMAPVRIRISPECRVPRLEKSRDYPLEIHVL